MARIRTIKPELATHEDLFDLEQETGLPIRFAWCMLFTVCDREGRFVWRPRTLKAQILPHDEIDFSRVLHAWLTRGFIVKYRVGHEWYGWLPTFTRHQIINNRESQSVLPDPDTAEDCEDYRDQALPNACATLEARVPDACPTREVHAQGEGKGREGKGKEGDSVLRTDVANATPARHNGIDRELESAIIAAYHETLPDLPQVRDWNDRRKRKLRARIQERIKAGKPADTVEYWEGFFRKVAASDFLMGRKKDWRCPGLEWLLEQKNFTKTIEGGHDNHGRS